MQRPFFEWTNLNNEKQSVDAPNKNTTGEKGEPKTRHRRVQEKGYEASTMGSTQRLVIQETSGEERSANDGRKDAERVDIQCIYGTYPAVLSPAAKILLVNEASSRS